MAESGKRVFWNEDCVHSQSVVSPDFIFFWGVEGSVRWREGSLICSFGTEPSETGVRGFRFCQTLFSVTICETVVIWKRAGVCMHQAWRFL